MSSPQNASLEGETWTEQRPDHLQHPPSVKEEDLKWEKEPGTQITVTINEEEEAADVHGQKSGEDEHQILKEAEEEEQVGSSDGKQSRITRVNAENKARDGERIQGENRVVDQSVSPSVDATLALLSSTQYFSSAINPSSITTTTQSSADITQINPAVEDQNLSLSSHFSALKNKSVLSTDKNRMHEKSSMGQIESSEDNVDADPTAMAARAGPTAISLPNTFKPEPKPKLPKVKDRQLAKAKKNKLQRKQKKVKEKSTTPLKNAKQVKKVKQEKDQLTIAPYFPYFKDHYCPPDCACYGRCVSNTALNELILTSVKSSDL